MREVSRRDFKGMLSLISLHRLDDTVITVVAQVNYIIFARFCVQIHKEAVIKQIHAENCLIGGHRMHIKGLNDLDIVLLLVLCRL